ncbi:MAG: two component, sigma54 specific, transcriptional regulator, Fis family [Deferribacteraceae bacterium]|nr:two component, sigma54 specific, transcriptional regulator, Fis family [Deferribacteraceae bacterium]
MNFVKKYSNEFRKNIVKIEPDIYKKLYDYSWPGNIRELENVIERAVALSDNDILTSDNIILENNLPSDSNESKIIFEYEKARKIFEKQYLKNILDFCDGNVLKASKYANLNPATLHRKINKYLK